MAPEQVKKTMALSVFSSHLSSFVSLIFNDLCLWLSQETHQKCYQATTAGARVIFFPQLGNMALRQECVMGPVAPVGVGLSSYRPSRHE